MPFRVIQPPSDEKNFTEAGKRVYAASQELGMNFDPEGFLFSWVNGVRVVVEEVDDEIVGIGLVATGRRWTHNDTTASVLNVESKGDYDGLIDFMKQIATAFGCTEMFVENKAIQRNGDTNIYTVVGHLLG